LAILPKLSFAFAKIPLFLFSTSAKPRNKLIDRDELPLVKAKIRKFIQNLEGEVASKKVAQLYQLQVQLFPVTENFNKKHEIYKTQKNT